MQSCPLPIYALAAAPRSCKRHPVGPPAKSARDREMGSVACSESAHGIKTRVQGHSGANCGHPVPEAQNAEAAADGLLIDLVEGVESMLLLRAITHRRIVVI